MVNVYLMCGNTWVRAFNSFKVSALHTTAVSIQEVELVGRLGQRGCAAQISSRGPGQTPRHVAW